MKFFTGRNKGKTTKLIRLCALKGGYIVCAGHMTHSIHKQSIAMGYNIPYPLSYDEFINHRYWSKRIEQVFIDDVDLLLEYISDVPIAYATISNFKEIPIVKERVNGNEETRVN